MSLNVLPNLSIQIIDTTNHRSGLGDGLQIRKRHLVGLCQEKEMMLFNLCTQLKLSE